MKSIPAQNQKYNNCFFLFLLFFIYIYCVFCALANLKTTRPSKMQDNPSFPKIMANWAHLWFIVWFTWFSNLTRKNCFTYVSAKQVLKNWKKTPTHDFTYSTWFQYMIFTCFLQAVIFLHKKKQKKYCKKLHDNKKPY